MQKKAVATTSQAPIYRPDDEFHLLVLWDFLCVVGVLWCCVVYYNGGTFLRTYKAPQYNDMAMMQER